jgi:hypothetical protein
MASEIYFSVDVETDGPIPGPHSMLSFAAVSFDLNGPLALVDPFYATLELLPGSSPHPRTKIEFWDKNPEAFAATRIATRQPEEAMKDFAAWVKLVASQNGGNGKAVFVGYPAGFDFTFVYWYLMYFLGESPFSFQAIDIKTLAMVALGTQFRETTKRNMPRHWWQAGTKHTHLPVDDATEQGWLFVNIMKQLGGK